MKIQLDRSMPISLARQIKGQILYAVTEGKLRCGDRLPSVRELATTLKVAPMTISQVYRELCQEGFVIPKPGLGTFVADIYSAGPSLGSPTPHINLHQLVNTCVRQAVLLGHTVDEVRTAFETTLDNQPSKRSSRRIAIVGNFRLATESYAREIEAMLQDLHVTVESMLVSELKTDRKSLLQKMDGVQLVATVPTRLQEVRTLLEPCSLPVVAVAFRASLETRRALSSIPPTSRVGVVSTYPEFLKTLFEEVASYGLSGAHPRSAVIGQDDDIRDMLAHVDVVVYASGSESILERLPSGVEAIEYRHSPEPDSVNRLRPLISELVMMDRQEEALGK